MKKNLLFLRILPFLVAAAFFATAHLAHADSISFDASAVGNYSAGGTDTWSHTTSGSNRILFVGLGGDTTDVATGCTYAGTPMTLAGKKLGGNGNLWTYLYYLVNPASGANSVVCSSPGQMFGSSVSYDGASQSGLLDATSTNNADPSTAFAPFLTTLTTTADNSWGVEVAVDCDAIDTFAGPGTGRIGLPLACGVMMDTAGPTTPPGVTSINAESEGTNGIASVMASFAPALSVPGAPQSLSAISENNQVGLTWSAPLTGDPPATYQIFDRLTGGGSYSFSTSTPASQTSTTITGLINGQSYDFEVFADNAAGTSTPATASSTPNPGPPTAPQSLSATPGNAQVSLSWSAPSSNGGSPVTGYRVYDGLTASSSFVFYASTTASQTTSTVTSLLNNNNYSFEVFAQNALGSSTAATVSATPTNFATSTTSGGNWSATSTWQGGVVPGDGYFVTVQGPVIIDQNLGSVSGGGIKNITLTGSAAVLSVSTSSPRTILFGSTGTNAEGSGSAIAPGTDGNMFGFIVYQGTLSLVGTQADPVTIEAANGSSPIYINKLYGPPYQTGSLFMQYADVYNLGTSATSSDCSTTGCFQGIFWDNNNATASTTVDIENSRFTSPYEILSMNNELPGAIKFISNYITGRIGPETISIGLGGNGSETIIDNTEVSPVTDGLFYLSYYEPDNAVFEGNALSGTTSTFIGGFEIAQNGVGNAAIIRYNLLYNYPDALSALTYSTFGDVDQNELAGIGVVSGTPYLSTVDSNISEGAYKAIDGAGEIVTNNFITGSVSLGQGQLFLNGSTHTMASTIVKNNIVMYFPADPNIYGANGLVLQYQGADNVLYDHNTFIGAATSSGIGASGDSGLVIGEVDTNVSTTIRSNLIDNTAYGIYDRIPGNVYSPDFDGVGVHHNDVYQFGYAGYVANPSSTDFDDGVHPHPNSIYGDVTLDPEFFDPARNSILQYDARVLGGPGTAADIFTQLGYRSGWGGTNTLGSNPINDMRQWLFAGYAPTNAALLDSAADGGVDGAVPLSVDVTPPSITLINPAALSVISGTATLTASSTDDVAVAGVQFQIDGINLGSEVTTTSSPDLYSTTWDTTGATNANHIITAIAYDTSNNTSSAMITVTVNNTGDSGAGGQSTSSTASIGVSSGYGMPYGQSGGSTLVNIPSASSMPSTIENELAGLQAQLQILLEEAGASSDRTPAVGEAASGGQGSFLKNLRFAEFDPDVLRLQAYLNEHGFPLANYGPGSPGKETERFGYATLYQLKRFQLSVGILATGFFGPLTRGYINSH